LSLVLAVARLALVGVLGEAFGEMSRRPLRLGPPFAFVIASSELSPLGLDPLFCALVGGTGPRRVPLTLPFAFLVLLRFLALPHAIQAL